MNENLKDNSVVNLKDEIDLKLDLNNYLTDQTNSNLNTNNTNLNNKSDKKKIEKNWFNISEKEVTPAVMREWKSIQLRGFVDPKKFYKNSKKLENIPKQFQLGTIVSDKANIEDTLNTNTNASGIKTSNVIKTRNVIKKTRVRKKPTLITSTVKESEWVSKRYKEIQNEKTSGRKGWYQRQVKKRKKT
uniref:Fcf2 pre-rRNA processing, putative n=1 Tax=Theileria annulata TaxID=5874 RepID=A0A3B0ML94_THEAN